MTAADRRKLNKDAGFSLLELLIAVVILAIIVIPLLNLFLSSNKLNIKSRQTLRATTAAQDIMEGLKAYNIEEVKAQFDEPANGFYVIDSRLIKGSVAEEKSQEMDGLGRPADGLYIFSMKELNLQGSKFDAKITVDGRGYKDLDPALFPCAGGSPSATSHIFDPTFFSGEKCTVCGVFKDAARKHTGFFNDAVMVDARSIDKNNGTFVEEEKIRQAVLKSVFKDSDMKNTIEAELRASGVADVNLAGKYMALQDTIHYKNLTSFFDKVGRTITIELSDSAERDEKNHYKVDMKITEEYIFDYHYDPALGTGARVITMGDIDSRVMVNGMSCGSIARMVEPDPATGADVEKINVNLFYYPLYGPSGKVSDKIIIENKTKAGVNLLVAKQRHETIDVSTGLPDLNDPEYLTDPQLMAAEQNYRAEIEIKDTYGFDPDKFSLKTNLGLNLVGKKYLMGAPVEVASQISVTGTGVSLGNLNIFTLDGVRSALGKPGAEASELIYDVEVAVYEEGAAAAGFPVDKRMVVIEGSMMN